jgi:hypothetical protein
LFASYNVSGIVNFFEDLGKDIENEYNNFAGKMSELFLSVEFDHEIAEAERTLHGQAFGPVLDEGFLKDVFTSNLEFTTEVRVHLDYDIYCIVYLL